MESWSDWVESEKAESDGEKNDAKNNVNGIWTEKWINMSEKLYTMFKILSKKKTILVEIILTTEMVIAKHMEVWVDLRIWMMILCRKYVEDTMLTIVKTYCNRKMREINR